MADKVKIDILFVEPVFFGKGTGGKLLNMTVRRPMVKGTLSRY